MIRVETLFVDGDDSSGLGLAVHVERDTNAALDGIRGREGTPLSVQVVTSATRYSTSIEGSDRDIHHADSGMLVVITYDDHAPDERAFAVRK